MKLASKKAITLSSLRGNWLLFGVVVSLLVCAGIVFYGYHRVQAASLISLLGQANATGAPTQRKVVETSDGTIHTFIRFGSTTKTCQEPAPAGLKSGLLWMSSSDGGDTWSCRGQMTAATTLVASVNVDSSDNIYVVYASLNNGGGSTSDDVFYRKLTKQSGSNWSLGSEQLLLNSTLSTTGYTYVSSELEGDARLWLAVRSRNSPDYNVKVYYTDGLSETPTLTESATLDTSSTSANRHIPSVVRYGNNIGVLYSAGDDLRWRTRSDSDPLTSWSSETTVLDGSIDHVGFSYSAVVDGNNNVHAVAHMGTIWSTGPIQHSYFNGTTWSAPVTLASSNIVNNSNNSVQVTTDGTNVWVFWADATGFAQAPSLGRIVHKKGVPPFAAANFDSNATPLNSSDRLFDKVWSQQSGVFTDETVDAGDIDVGDTQTATALNDAIYFGMTEKFRTVTYLLNTNGSGGVFAWEYWNGTSWTALTMLDSISPNMSSGCTTPSNCGILFTPPANWQQTTVHTDSGSGYYYLRARVTTAFTTSPEGTQIKAALRVCNISTAEGATSQINLMWTDSLSSQVCTSESDAVQFSALETGSNVAPEISSQAPSADVPTTDTTPTLSFDIDDANPFDTVRYQLQIDNDSNFSSPVVDYTSALMEPDSVSFTVGQAAGTGTYALGNASQTLPEGSYYWRVRGTDSEGLAGSYSAAGGGAVAFTVDTTVPSVPGLPTPSANPTNDQTPSWSWAASSDSGSGLSLTAPYTVQWSVDPTFSAGVTTTTSTLPSFTHGSALPDGTHYMRVAASDEVSNDSAYSTVGFVVIDSQPPTTPTGLSSPGQTIDSIDLEWDASTDANGVEGYRVYRNGVEISTTTSTSFTDTSLLANTSYAYNMAAYDGLGNLSAESQALVVKTKAYQVPVSSPGGPIVTQPDIAKPVPETLQPFQPDFVEEPSDEDTDDANEPSDSDDDETVGVMVAIKIVDNEQRPVVGAEVTLDTQTSITDDEGIARFTDIKPGDYSVRVVAPDGSSAVLGVSVDSNAGGSGAIQHLELALPPQETTNAGNNLVVVVAGILAASAAGYVALKLFWSRRNVGA